MPEAEDGAGVVNAAALLGPRVPAGIGLDAGRAPADALAELVEGVDARGRHPYGLPALAADELVHFGSCTANPVTPALLARHDVLRAATATIAPERYLQLLYGAAQCRLAASGTDAEYSVALALGDEPFHNVLVDPHEIGSGCARAAAGLAHVRGGPVTAPLALRVELASVALRDARGAVLAAEAVDARVIELVTGLAPRPVLLHHVPCTKTGLAAPSEAACIELQRALGPRLRVVVDASQGRYAHGDVRRWLDLGWAVIVTGSKFRGAPPFCGATLFPEGWPRALGFPVGPGVVARWRLAIDALALEPSRRDWACALEQALLPPLRRLPHFALDGAIERQGICSFDLGLDAERTLALHRRLIGRGFFIGQPVEAGPRRLLRVALGART
ncbi:MAG: hypothetical protein KGO01_22990, partial [Burkholderiales bacterium]|nr:hypothetical protein [Burkholderiales bacterium]